MHEQGLSSLVIMHRPDDISVTNATVDIFCPLLETAYSSQSRIRDDIQVGCLYDSGLSQDINHAPLGHKAKKDIITELDNPPSALCFRERVWKHLEKVVQCYQSLTHSLRGFWGPAFAIDLTFHHKFKVWTVQAFFTIQALFFQTDFVGLFQNVPWCHVQNVKSKMKSPLRHGICT